MITAISASALSITEVVKALRKGDIDQVTLYLDDVVRITIDEKTHPYSRSQAEVILRNFFRSRTVRSLTVLHQEQGTASEYFIGTLQTEPELFRTTVFMRLRGERKVIHELRFERL